MNRPLYTLDQMVVDFGSYRRQINAIIADGAIPTWVIGKRLTVVDQDGYDAVKLALHEYRTRPVLAQMRRGRAAV